MGRYSSYGIATLYAIPLKDLEDTIRRRAYGKTLADFNVEDLRVYYPEEVYDIEKTDTAVLIQLRDCFNGADIFSLLKEFASIAPNKGQLEPETVEEIGKLIKDKSIDEVLELAEERKFEGFQDLDLPYYLYYTPVPIGGKRLYARTMVKGILLNYNYSKTDTEDDSQPYDFLTELLRYRLKENPLAPALLAYLSV